ncbi:MAG: hypothetical protein QNJ30_13310 [Kiloniellales bacterium]|nr:hypothetical protein [Kiloniellales bacterium]
MTWQAATEDFDGGRARKVTLLRAGTAVSYAEVAENWRRDEAFNAFFSDLLAAAPFPAFFWETPPVTAYTLGQAFECVLIDSPALARLEAEPAAFARAFAAAPEDEAVTFENLGRDAWLVAPRPLPEAGDYPHLAAFLRTAPAGQKAALWRQTGEAVIRLLSERPLWVSTSGLGVAWLHLRLDTRPKYYVFHPYRSAA